MTSQGFSFPPPPPPPPPQQRPPSFQTPASPYGQSGYGARGGRGSGGQHRGRGRGYGGRGGRGGHFGAPNPGHTAPYHANPPAAVNQSYAQVNYGAYPAQHYPTAASSASPSPYNASRPTSYQPSHGQPGFAPGQPYAQSPAPHLPSYPPQPSYDTSYNASTKLPQSTSYPPPTPAGFPSSIPPPPPPPHTSTSAPHAPPAVMGPPMRWGFDDRRPTRYYPEGTRSFKPNPSYGLRPLNTSNPYPGPTPAADKFTRNGNKRPYSSAFGKPQATAPQTLAPPPVPSFGNPLPAKPPPAVDPTRKPKKKKRKHNQLGLTPKTDEHESSEEEDDVDEEAKLGQGKVSGSLQFTYKGRTSTLQTPEEIAAWIEERKKRYPTQARIEEKKKAMEEAKKARDEALKEKEKQKEEARRQQKEARAQKERDKLERKEQREQSTDPIDAALKAKLKAEKLRRKLIKEEKRVARAEADAERARLRAEALQKAAKIGHAGPDTQQETAQDPPATTTTNPLVEEEKSVQALEDEGEAPNGIPSTVEPAATGETSQMGPDGHISASSEESDTSDWTSSSGSDLSSSESEDSDDDSAPEEVSSRREGPERVAPPPREAKKKKLCRHFARNGRCSRGDKCRFLHEKPDKRTGDKRGKEKPRRKGLLQALLARQREDEDRRVMQAIMLLGERGMLDEPAAEGPKPTPDSIPDGEKADDAVGGAVSGSAPAPETVGGEASV
ncbi:CCCH zinc finger protein [Thermoascus aurantiacus ATCC 26904]